MIDLQNDITKNYKKIIAKVNEAIDWAEQKELWIVYIQHNNLSAGQELLLFKSIVLSSFMLFGLMLRPASNLPAIT